MGKILVGWSQQGADTEVVKCCFSGVQEELTH